MDSRQNNLLTDKVINNLLLEIQSHSGRSINSKLLQLYKLVFSNTEIYEQWILDKFLVETVNSAMRVIHQISNKTRNWKSYDW